MKVLMLLDGEHFPKDALEFAEQLNGSERILLTGLFLPSIDYSDVILFYLGGLAGPPSIPSGDISTDSEVVKHNMEQFKAYCERNGIEYRVHNEIDDHVRDLIRRESTYSDLMLMSGSSFYSNLDKATQHEYTEDAMLMAGCPLIVVPENYSQPQNIVIAYDGSPSSVFALKQFAYVLPHLCDLPATVVYSTPKDEDIPELSQMEELCARHFNDLTFFKLETDARHYFSTWLRDRGRSMLVTGSYAHRKIFKRHFIDDVIKDNVQPIFIAHAPKD